MLSKIKKNANDIFSETGYPSMNNEDWKYTSTHFFSNCTSYNTELNKISTDNYIMDGAINIVLVNGKISDTIDKKIKGLTLLSLDDNNSTKDFGKFLQISDYNKNGVIAHNTSEFQDAVHLTIDSNYNSDIPINIISVATKLKAQDIIFPRFYIHAKKKSNSKIFIQHINNNTKGAGNAVSEFYCEELSSTNIIHVSNIKNQKFIDSIIFNQDNNSKIKFLSTSFGGELYRSNIDININGKNCDNKFGVLILGSDQDHIDYHTNINHKASHSISDFSCRSMLNGKANGIFNGKILVAKGASGTNATLNNNNLLLSNTSAMQSNPQLEINCEDVKCSHGSTSGNLDKDALFYLCSRGIDEDAAKEILIQGFISKLLSLFNTEKLSLESKVKEWIQV